MRIFDISMTISKDMTVYKNKDEKKPNITTVQDFSTSSSYESRIEMGTHTGTHLDAPLHMIENGKSMDSFDLHRVITNCKVIDLSHISEKITYEDLKDKNINKDDFILLKTRNSNIEEFDFNFVYLEKSGAQYLKGKNIKGVGIDALGIERGQPNHDTHKILLSEGIAILEGLRLKEINEGEYFLAALPLKIKNVEAVPVRAVLVKFD